MVVGSAALLYGAALFCASPAQAAPASAPAQASAVASRTAGFIAVILPTKSKQLKPAAEAVKAGVLAQEKVSGIGDLPPVRIFETTERAEETTDQFLKAWELGAVAVIGPLTRDALGDLASKVSSLPIPVVALNSFDESSWRRPNLYSLNLSIEAEAAQVARMMRAEGVMRPVVIQSETALSRRIAQGFADGWVRQPTMLTLRDAKKDSAGLFARLGDADAVFLATDSRTSSVIRPYLGNSRMIFATSQIDPGRQSSVLIIDLAGIRYLETPWLADPENPVYAPYARTRSSLSDVERLFALGADAWRVAQSLAQGMQLSNVQGLSGTLTVGEDRVVQRELVPKTLNIRMALPTSLTETVASQPAAATFPFAKP